MNASDLRAAAEDFGIRLEARAAMLEAISDQVEQEDVQIMLHRLTEDLKRDLGDYNREILSGVYEA
jgi:hypothetical protein